MLGLGDQASDTPARSLEGRSVYAAKSSVGNFFRYTIIPMFFKILNIGK